MASSTRGWLWPTFATPTPPTKSTNVLPSTSVIVDPRARSATIRSWTMSGRATARRSRSRISRLRGPGISVRISITRVAATRGSLSVRHVGEASCRPVTDHPYADDPIAQLTAWLDDASGAVGEPRAMTLATATPDGRPAARVVLLRGLDEHGLTFFTNRSSRKGEDLRRNP